MFQTFVTGGTTWLESRLPHLSAFAQITLSSVETSLSLSPSDEGDCFRDQLVRCTITVLHHYSYYYYY